jgi:glycosyltransferase involved in cell wall biosynthesis
MDSGRFAPGCISEATKLDVLRLAGKPAKKVTTIYLGLDPTFEAELHGRLNEKTARGADGAFNDKELSSRESTSDGIDVLSQDLPASYLLHVGGNTWYKNRQGVLHIYFEIRRRLGSLAPNLIVVGPPLGPEIPGVQFLEEITDPKLADLYRNAALLLFPSLYEGFGWPVVEANACGCPAVVSKIAPLIEAGGDASILISDPRDIREAADRVMEVLVGDSLTKQRRREAGFQNAGRFSRGQMITQYLELYASIAQE